MSHTPSILDIWTRYASSTNGRDKLYRTVQYAAKLIAWHTQQKGWATKETVTKLNSLSSALSVSRKRKAP